MIFAASTKTLSLDDAVRALSERLRWIALAGVLGLLAAYGVALVLPVEYTSSFKLYVSAQSETSANNAYQGGLLSQQRVKSYTDLITSDRVVRDTLSRLNSSESTPRFASEITATSNPDSVVIDASVIGRSPSEASQKAQALAEVFVNIIAEIERPANPTIPAPVEVRIVQPATIPTAPSSTSPLLLAGLGLLVGVLLSVGYVIVRRFYDDSIRSEAEVMRATNLPTIGVIPRPKKMRSAEQIEGLVTDLLGPESEAYRQVRANLDYFNLDQRSPVTLISSAKQGEGKSTLAANLASAFARSGKRTILVDCDLRRPRAASLLSLERSVGFTSVVTGKLPLEKAVQKRSAENLFLLASGPLPPNPSELLGSQQTRTILAQLRQSFEIVILDSPPVLPVSDALSLVGAVDGVVLVAAQIKTTATELNRAAENLRRVNAPVMGVVMTMVETTRSSSYGYYRERYSDGENTSNTVTNSGGENGVHWRDSTSRPDRLPDRKPVPFKRGNV